MNAFKNWNDCNFFGLSGYSPICLILARDWFAWTLGFIMKQTLLLERQDTWGWHTLLWV